MELAIAILGAYLLYQIQNNLYRRFWEKNLSVDIAFSKDNAVEGEEIHLIETITNRKLLPLPVLQMKFMTTKNFEFADTNNSVVSDNYYRNDMVSIMMYQKMTKALSFSCRRRGFYTINRMDIVCSNLFLTYELVDSFNINITLYVYPKPLELPKFDITFRKMLGSVMTKRFINEDPFEFRNIREYQTYDNMKTINWKASAKTSSLMVNVHDYTSSQQVKIFINVESDTIWIYEDLQEESIRIASALAISFINQGIPVSVYSNAKDIITKECMNIPAGSGSNHIRTIQETLARLDLTQVPPAFVPSIQEEFHNASSKDYIIIISSYQRNDLQQYLIAKQQSKTEFVWVIPTNHEVKVSVDEELAAVVTEWELEE